METTKTDRTSRPTRAADDPALVEPMWLAHRVDNPDIRVVEVDVSSTNYDNGHIDKAVLWNVYTDLKDPDYRTVDRHDFAQLLGRSGITANTTVVFYGYAPALGLWLMKLYGHHDVGVLDCSRDTWEAYGYPWSTAAAEPLRSEYLLGEEDPALRADLTAVRKAIGRAGLTLLDVRSGPEYRGERFWPSGGSEPGGRAGHIPSAVHQPIEDI